MWLINSNTYEIFSKYKKDEPKEVLDFYKNISNISMDDDDWLVEIDFNYKDCKFHMDIDFDGNILNCYTK